MMNVVQPDSNDYSFLVSFVASHFDNRHDIAVIIDNGTNTYDRHDKMTKLITESSTKLIVVLIPYEKRTSTVLNQWEKIRLHKPLHIRFWVLLLPMLCSYERHECNEVLYIFRSFLNDQRMCFYGIRRWSKVPFMDVQDLLKLLYQIPRQSKCEEGFFAVHSSMTCDIESICMEMLRLIYPQPRCIDWVKIRDSTFLDIEDRLYPKIACLLTISYDILNHINRVCKNELVNLTLKS